MHRRESSLRSLVKKHPRSTGLVLLLAGSGLFYWQVWLPVQAAATHAREIHFSSNGPVAAVLASLLGLCQVTLGSIYTRLIEPIPGRSRLPGYALILLLIGCAFGTDQFLKSYLVDQGYTLFP